jgi:hypothetical protein
MKNYIYVILLIAGFVGCGGGDGATLSTSKGSTGSGKGGSMARFAISGDYLYTVKGRSMEVFDISVPDDPISYTHTYDVPFDVETLYSYKDYIYLGSKTGVSIYTKPTKTANLDKIGEFSHIKSCDPVVVSEDLAYVTLNSSSSCRTDSNTNELEILNVKDPKNPSLLYTQRTYLKAPSGLGVDSGKVFICDKGEGLKIFDINKTKDDNNQTIISLNFDRNNSILDLECYDLIAHNNLLIVSSGENVTEYDYTHFPMQELAKIK